MAFFVFDFTRIIIVTTAKRITLHIITDIMSSDYVNAMNMAKKIGFRCINTDIIAGLPGEDCESFYKSVRDVAMLEIEELFIKTIFAFFRLSLPSAIVIFFQSFSVPP